MQFLRTFLPCSLGFPSSSARVSAFQIPLALDGWGVLDGEVEIVKVPAGHQDSLYLNPVEQA